MDKGYFRIYDGSGSDDEPRDEEFSFVPQFVPHFRTIGFPEISTDPYIERDYFDACKSYFTNNDKVEARNEIIPSDDADDDEPNICILRECVAGVQLWGAACPPRGLFSGFIPHFFGKSRCPLCIISSTPGKLLDPEDNKVLPLPHASLLCTYDDRGDAGKFLRTDEHTLRQGGITLADLLAIVPDKGSSLLGKGFIIPETREAYNVFCFHCHNIAFKEESSNPMNVVCQLTGFANEEVFCHDSLEDFEKWSKEKWIASTSNSPCEGDDPRLANPDARFSSCFFGTGDKVVKKTMGLSYDQHAMIIGHVVETEVKINDHTGEVFVWALIRTAKDMEVDVVFRQSLIESRGSPMPKVGGILVGYFWLSGVILLDGANEYL